MRETKNGNFPSVKDAYDNYMDSFWKAAAVTVKAETARVLRSYGHDVGDQYIDQIQATARKEMADKLRALANRAPVSPAKPVGDDNLDVRSSFRVKSCFGNEWGGRSISDGTLAEIELIPAFIAVIKEGDILDGDSVLELESEWGNCGEDNLEGASALLDDLFDLLNETAPAGHCFGPNDGAFGFWPVAEVNDLDRLPEGTVVDTDKKYDGLQSKTELPKNAQCESPDGPGNKYRSKGKGRGLGRGKGKGPLNRKKNKSMTQGPVPEGSSIPGGGNAPSQGGGAVSADLKKQIALAQRAATELRGDDKEAATLIAEELADITRELETVEKREAQLKEWSDVSGFECVDVEFGERPGQVYLFGKLLSDDVTERLFEILPEMRDYTAAKSSPVDLCIEMSSTGYNDPGSDMNVPIEKAYPPASEDEREVSSMWLSTDEDYPIPDDLSKMIQDEVGEPLVDFIQDIDLPEYEPYKD
jgi:hypothetical protein